MGSRTLLEIGLSQAIIVQPGINRIPKIDQDCAPSHQQNDGRHHNTVRTPATLNTCIPPVMHETNTASARHSHPEGGCPSGTGGPDQVCLSDNERDKGSSTAQSVTELAFSVIESPYSSYYAREVEKLERDIARLERFEIGSSLVGDVARTIELIAPAGAIVGIISKFLGYVKSIKTIKLEALGLVRSAVETTLFMQSTMVKVEWNVPPEMLDSIKHFYEVLKDCTSSMYRVVDKTSFLHEVLNRNKYRDMLKDMSSRLLSARHDFTQSAIIISASYTYRLMPSHSGHAEAEKQLDDIDLRKTLAETARVEREKLGEFLGLDDLTLDEMVELRDAIGARRRARAGTAHEPSASSSIARPPVAITQATSSRDQDLVDSGRHTVLFMLNEIVYDNDPYNPPLSDTSLKEASITEDLVDVFLDRVHEVLSEKIAEQLKNREIASPSPKAEKVIQAVQAYESMTAESGNEGNGKGRSQSAKLSQTIQDDISNAPTHSPPPSEVNPVVYKSQLQHKKDISTSDVAMTTTATNESTKHTEKRQMISCQLCRARKLRCDGLTPCASCIRRGLPEECAYSTETHKRGQSTENISDRLSRLKRRRESDGSLVTPQASP